jgi:hypothetical protein
VRGLVLGLFLVAVVFALRPFDPDWDFNWRKLAWWSTGRYFTDLALPGGAVALFFLAGFFELPLAWVEARAARVESSLGRDVRAVALAVALLVVCGATLAFQSLYLGHTFDGEPSLRRPLRYFESDLVLLRDSAGAIAERAVALFSPFVVGMYGRIRSVASPRIVIGGALVCLAIGSLNALLGFAEFWSETAAPENQLVVDFQYPRGYERYLVLSVCLGALEPLLVAQADKLDARLSRWLSPDDAA